MYRGNQQTTGQGKSSQDQPITGSGIDNPAALPFEVDAEIKETGEPITLLQTCNWPGHSPSFVAVDVNGDPLIASFTEVRVKDRRVLPNPKLAQQGQERVRR